MINNFANCLAFTLKQEGGFSDDKNDPGGATMKGITLATYRQYVKRNATKSDLKKISDANVEMIYRDEYWMRVHGPEIPVGLDLGVFDFAVHSGVERAIIGLQLAVGTPEDGSFGPKTLAAMQSANAEKAINALWDYRLAFMKKLPGWKYYKNGWTTRVREGRACSLKMITTS